MGARQGWRRPIRFSHAAGEEPAGSGPYPAKRGSPLRAAIWVATRSFSSHEDEGSFCFSARAGRRTPYRKEELTVIDINLIRKTPDVVRENIKKKFQDSKLVLVD